MRFIPPGHVKGLPTPDVEPPGRPADPTEDMAHGLAHSEFVLHYQPIVSLSDLRILGVEALVRWQHPERGLVPPDQFISLAEDSGLIVPLGAWVLHEACGQAARWQATEPALERMKVAVNLSGRQLLDGEIVATVLSALDESGLDPRCLELEITESMLMVDVEGVGRLLAAIKALGVGISVDDFGTGFSSLAYLKRFPVDVLKVDKSFVDGICTDLRDVAIVGAIVALAGALGLDTVAEGVETEEQASLLASLGCAHAQGYHFCRPVPAAEIAARVGAGAPASPRDRSRERPRVLICDDEPAIRRLYRRAAEASGAEVFDAGDAESCLAQLDDVAPHLVVLDVTLPGRGGLDILAEVRTRCPRAFVEVVSGVVSHQTLVAALDLGAHDCVPKMIFLPRLRFLIELCRQRA